MTQQFHSWVDIKKKKKKRKKRLIQKDPFTPMFIAALFIYQNMEASVSIIYWMDKH